MLFLNIIVQANGVGETEIKYSIKEYAKIQLDSISTDSTLKIDWAMYLGPASIDVDSLGYIYLINSDNNEIVKSSRNGKILWRYSSDAQIMDIQVLENELFAFDSRNLLVLNAINGNKLEQINLNLKNEDVTSVGNVSKFFGQYLMINKWPVKTKELIHIFDLKTKKMSDRVPAGINLYPVFNCSSCTQDFVQSLFANKGNNFIDQSEKYVLYVKSNDRMQMYGEFYLFNKNSGNKLKLTNIPFFKIISFTTIRFCKFIDSRRFVVCAIESVDYSPVSLNFYEITF